MRNVATESIAGEIQMLQIFQCVECVAHFSGQIIIVQVDCVQVDQSRQCVGYAAKQLVAPEMDCGRKMY